MRGDRGERGFEDRSSEGWSYSEWVGKSPKTSPNSYENLYLKKVISSYISHNKIGTIIVDMS
jgi:hypothetical protein